MIRSLRLLALFSFVSLMTVPGAYAGVPCPEGCPGDLNGDGQVKVDELVRAVNAALTGCEAPPPPGSSVLLQTGQAQCDQGSGDLGPCPGSPAGQDGAVQAGLPLSYTDNGDGTITDNASGLMWEKLANDDSVHDWDNVYTWQEALNGKLAELNSEPCFAGHCDWRLPNRRELESLVSFALMRPPAIDPVFGAECEEPCGATTCGCTQFDYYWTSTNYEDLPGFAWCVNPNLGSLTGFEKILPLYVRAVRGGL